jgi:hypothetical protein
MLEPQGEYMLAKRWREHGDRDAAHKLVTSHLRARMAIPASGRTGWSTTSTTRKRGWRRARNPTTAGRRSATRCRCSMTASGASSRRRRLADDPITLEDLAAEFGVSRERVRQIEVRAFDKVQSAVKNRIGAMETRPSAPALQVH